LRCARYRSDESAVIESRLVSFLNIDRSIKWIKALKRLKQSSYFINDSSDLTRKFWSQWWYSDTIPPRIIVINIPADSDFSVLLILQSLFSTLFHYRISDLQPLLGRIIRCVSVRLISRASSARKDRGPPRLSGEYRAIPHFRIISDTLEYRSLVIVISRGADRASRDMRYHLANDRLRCNSIGPWMRASSYGQDQFNDAQRTTPGIHWPIASTPRVIYRVAQRREREDYELSLSLSVQRSSSGEVWNSLLIGSKGRSSRYSCTNLHARALLITFAANSLRSVFLPSRRDWVSSVARAHNPHFSSTVAIGGRLILSLGDTLYVRNGIYLAGSLQSHSRRMQRAGSSSWLMHVDVRLVGGCRYAVPIPSFEQSAARSLRRGRYREGRFDILSIRIGRVRGWRRSPACGCSFESCNWEIS